MKANTLCNALGQFSRAHLIQSNKIDPIIILDILN